MDTHERRGSSEGTGMSLSSAPEFVLDDITTGPYAHGFGTTGDGRTFAFRVHRHTLTVMLYRADAHLVPDDSEIAATVEASVKDVDLCDERSIAAVVRDAVAEAEAEDAAHTAHSAHQHEGFTRAILHRLSAVLDGHH